MPRQHGATRAPAIISVLLLAALGAVFAYHAAHRALAHLHQVLEPQLEQQLGRDVRLGRVRLSGFGSVVIDGLAVPDGPTFASGTLVRVRRATLSFSLIRLLGRGQTPVAAIDSLTLLDPDLTLVRQRSGVWNVSTLLRSRTRRPVWQDFRGRLVLDNARITVRDFRSGALPAPVTTRLQRLSLRLDARQMPLLHWSLSARGDGRALGQVALEGRYDLNQRRLTMQTSFAGASVPHWQRYAAAAPLLPARSGAASGRLSFSWTAGDGPRLAGTVRMPRLVLVPPAIRQPLVAAPLIVQIDNERLKLDAEGQSAGMPLFLKGELVLRPHDTLLDLHVRAPQLTDSGGRRVMPDWPQIRGVAWQSAARVDAHVTGSSNNWRVDVTASLPRLLARGVAATDLRARFTYHRVARLFVIHSAEARAAGGTVTASGRVSVRTTPSQLLFRGRATSLDVTLLPFLSATRKSGRANATFLVQGPANGVRTQIQLTGDGIALGPARFGNLAADIAMPWEGPVEVTARASRIVPDPPQRPRQLASRGARPSAPLGAIGAGLPPAQSGLARFRVFPDRVEVQSGSLLLAGQPLSLSGTITQSGRLDLQIRAWHADAGALARLAGESGVSGRADLLARLRGTLSQPRVSATLVASRARVGKVTFGAAKVTADLRDTRSGQVAFLIRDARLRGVPIRSASGAATLRGGEITLHRLQADIPQGTLSAHGTVWRDGRLNLAVSAPKLDLARIGDLTGFGSAASTRGGVGGTAAVNGRLTGTASAPRFTGQVSARQGTLHGLDYDELRASIRASAGSVSVANLSLRRGRESVTLAGEASLRQGQPLAVQGRLRIASLDVAEALHALNLPLPLEGRAQADLEVLGAYPNVVVAGTFEIPDAVLAGVTVGRISGRLQRTDGREIRVERVAIENGQAVLVATGRAQVGGTLSLRVEGRHLPLALLNRLTQPYVVLDGTADLTGTVSGRTADPQVRLAVRGGPVLANGHDLGPVSGEVAYAGGEVRVANLELATRHGRYRVRRLSAWPGKPLIDAEASAAEADLAWLAAVARSVKTPNTPFGNDLRQRLAALPNRLQGTFSGQVQVHGPLARLSGSVAFAAAGLVAGEARVHRFAGTMSWAPGSIELRDGTLTADGVDVAGSIRHDRRQLATQLRLAPSRLESLRALAQNLAAVAQRAEGTAPDRQSHDSLARALSRALQDLPQPLAGNVSGQLALSGPRDALTGSAKVSLSEARLGETQIAQTSVAAHWDAGNVSVDDLRLRADGVDLAGSYSRRADGTLALHIQAEETDVVAVRDLARAAAALGQSPGRSLLPASARDILQNLPNPVGGRVSGTLSLSGPPEALAGEVNAVGREVRLGQAAYSLIEAEGSWSERGWSFPKLSLSGNGCTLVGSVAGDPAERLGARFATEGARIAALRSLVASLAALHPSPAAEKLVKRLNALPQPLDGVLSGVVVLGGTPAEPLTQVHLTATDLVVDAMTVPRLTADADIRGSAISIREFAASVNGGNLTAHGTLNLDGAVELSVQGTDLALAALRPALGLQQELAGHLDLSARVGGTWEAPLVQARAVARDAAVAGIRLGRIEADGVQIAGDRMDLGHVLLTGGAASLSVSGHVPFQWRPIAIPQDKPIQLAISVPQYDLASLAAIAKNGGEGNPLPLVPSAPQAAPHPLAGLVQSASGHAAAQLTVTGTIANPSMDGEIQMRDGSLRLATLDHALTDIHGAVRLQGPWMIVDNLSARSAQGGSLTLSGRAAVRGQAQEALDLRLRATQLRLAMQGIAGVTGLAYRGTIDGELALTGQAARARLTGTVNLSQSQLAIPPEMTAQMPPMPKLPLDPALDVNVRVVDGASIKRGRTLSATVTGSADLRGRLSQPLVGGRVAVERGDLHYAGVSFRLQPGGTASFAYETPGPWTTRLDVTAVTRVRALSPTTGDRRNYNITMRVVGALPSVNVTVTSDPPDLPQHRLLAILARTDQFEALARGEDLNVVLRDQVADILAGSVLPQVFEPIEAGLAQALGLDEVSFDYGFDRPLRVDARKEVLPRLYVSYNRDFSDGQLLESRQQWTVSYRLLQRLYVGWRHEAQTGRSDRIVLEGSFRF